MYLPGVRRTKQRVIPVHDIEIGGGRSGSALAPYLTIAEAADLVRVSSKRLRNLMVDGVLKEGVHYTRPRGLAPRFRREALLAWLEGQEFARPATRTRSRVDLSLIPRLEE